MKNLAVMLIFALSCASFAVVGNRAPKGEGPGATAHVNLSQVQKMIAPVDRQVGNQTENSSKNDYAYGSPQSDSGAAAAVASSMKPRSDPNAARAVARAGTNLKQHASLISMPWFLGLGAMAVGFLAVFCLRQYAEKAVPMPTPARTAKPRW